MKHFFFVLFAAGMVYAQAVGSGTGMGSGTGQMGLVAGVQYALTVTVVGFGTVTGSPNGIGNVVLSCPSACVASYTPGTVVTLTEAPGSGQTFSGWGGSCAGTTFTCVLTINATTAVTATFAGAGGGGGLVAAEPTSFVDNTICNPVGDVYDTEVVLGTTNNIGPNVAGSAIGTPYALTPNGLRDVLSNWRDNADNASQTPHFADRWWRVKIPAGTVLGASTYDVNLALISLVGKINAGIEPTKCLVVDSTTPLPAYTVTGSVTGGIFTNGERVRQTTSNAEATIYNAVTGSVTMQLGPMYGYPSQTNLYTWIGQSSGAIYTPTATPNRFIVCGRGLPGFGGLRNPGCDGHIAGPNDKASLWTLQMPATNLAIAKVGIYAGIDPVTRTNWTNHIVLRNGEITIAPGAAQSASGSHAARLFYADLGATGTYVFGVGPTFQPITKRFGKENMYLHGWDPGDAGQPGAGSGNVAVNSATGACLAWDFTGTVNTVNTDGSHGTLTVTPGSSGNSGASYFGMTFKVGSTVWVGPLGTPANPGLNGAIAYTISNATSVQNGTANNVVTVNGQPGTQTGVAFFEENPPAQYTPGCGDDVATASSMNCDSCWDEGLYIEKIHDYLSESHPMAGGYDIGPRKVAKNWVEGGSEVYFSGGNAGDTAGPAGSDTEIRENLFTHDLNWRQLTGSAGNSPAPPFGCGSISSTHANWNTCPFIWGLKNGVELKMGHRNLLDGNIIEDCWADGQSGFCLLLAVRTCSGGATCGVYNSVTGLPDTFLDNTRVSYNWVRNTPQTVQMASRSGNQTQITSNGGGVSAGTQFTDFVSNLFSNVGDTAQFGSPGFQWEWTSGGYSYTCAMSGTGVIATGTCLPGQVGMHNWVTKISKDVNNVVTVVKSQRTDPILCSDLSPSGLAACVTAGKTLIMGGAPGWNGSFAMSGTVGNWFADGTGGNNVIYTDNINPSGCVGAACTLCDNANPANKCSANPYVMTVATLGLKMTDICVPGQTGCSATQADGVYASNNTPDISCTTQGYAAGANASVYAVSGTITTGLIVKYPSTGTGAATCLIANGAGFPKSVVFKNNTFLPAAWVAITSYAKWWQPIANQFSSNVFVTNDTLNRSDMYCSGQGGGTAALGCWDPLSFQYYFNVMARSNPTYWTGSVINCPGGACVNAFPTAVDCPTATADLNCLGYSGFMNTGGSPRYPTGPCVWDGANSLNCPLMALPWANNFTLDDLTYVGSSVYSTQGVDIPTLKNHLTRGIYVCTGFCGDGTTGHRPYPD